MWTEPAEKMKLNPVCIWSAARNRLFAANTILHTFRLRSDIEILLERSCENRRVESEGRMTDRQLHPTVRLFKPQKSINTNNRRVSAGCPPVSTPEDINIHFYLSGFHGRSKKRAQRREDVWVIYKIDMWVIFTSDITEVRVCVRVLIVFLIGDLKNGLMRTDANVVTRHFCGPVRIRLD